MSTTPEAAENRHAGEHRPDRGPRSSGRRTASPRGARLLGVVLLVLLYALDQASKAWIVAAMHEGERITVVPGLLWWRFLRNPGAAFSMGESVTWIFTLILAAVAVAVLWFLPRARVRSWILALSGLLAGVLGNLTDRLFREPGFARGHVVDFISLPHYAIFNVADSCIVLSILTIVVLTFRGIPLEGRTAGTATGPDDAAATDTAATKEHA